VTELSDSETDDDERMKICMMKALSSSSDADTIIQDNLYNKDGYSRSRSKLIRRITRYYLLSESDRNRLN